MNTTVISQSEQPFPTFLMGSTILFWGWQAELLFFAIPVALLLEIARWTTWRWNLSDQEIHRVADISAVGWVGAALYLFNQQSVLGLFTLLSWLPLLFSPLLLIQTYNSRQSIPLTSLFISLRRHSDQSHFPFKKDLDIRYPYLVICLVAASVTQQQWFFVGTLFFVAWMLWQIRPQRYMFGVWVNLLILAAGASYGLQHGLYQLHGYAGDLLASWFENLFWQSRDPYQQHTALGHIGRLKQSERIIFRVTTAKPLLLREASYNAYFKQTWYAKSAQFSPLTATDHSRWQFTSQQQPIDNIRISGQLAEGRGMLALPLGTYQVDDLQAVKLESNPYGAVKIEQGTPWLNYRAYFSTSSSLDSPATEQDISLAHEPRLKAVLHQIHQQLDLSHATPQHIVAKLTDFFEQQFYYSLELPEIKDKNILPIENFLLHQRQGHCEYFATATVLLLREIGIPARYAVGYAVAEYSPLEDVYLVRKRHAHAWALAYINGQWQNVDTTPSRWVQVENNQSPWWQTIYNLGSWLTYTFQQWQLQQKDNRWLLWLVLPLIILLTWRLYFKERVAHLPQHFIRRKQFPYLSNESPFYLVFTRLEKVGYTRLPGETLHQWQQKIRLSPLLKEDLGQLLNAHETLRFSASRMNEQEKQQFQQHVQRWLLLYEQSH